MTNKCSGGSIPRDIPQTYPSGPTSRLRFREKRNFIGDGILLPILSNAESSNDDQE